MSDYSDNDNFTIETDEESTKHSKNVNSQKTQSGKKKKKRKKTKKTDKDYYEDAEAFFDNKEYEKAVFAYKEAIKLKNDPYYYYSLGFSYLKMSKFQNALDNFAVAIIEKKKIDKPENVPAEFYYGSGMANERLFNFFEAVEDYSNAIKIDENYEGALYNRGICYEKLKKFENSVSDLTRAIKLSNGELIEYFYSRGVAYDNMKKFKLAIKDYTKAISLKRNYHLALLNRGECYLKEGEYEEALNDFNRAIEIEESKKRVNGDSIYWKGLVLFFMGKYKYSIRVLTKAIELNVKNALFVRALAYESCNMFDEAYDGWIQVEKILSLKEKERMIEEFCNFYNDLLDENDEVDDSYKVLMQNHRRIVSKLQKCTSKRLLEENVELKERNRVLEHQNETLRDAMDVMKKNVKLEDELRKLKRKMRKKKDRDTHEKKKKSKKKKSKKRKRKETDDDDDDDDEKDSEISVNEEDDDDETSPPKRKKRKTEE